jgi:hypothetical protein
MSNNNGGSLDRIVRRMACVFGIHSWRCRAVAHFWDNSWTEPGAQSTTAMFVCSNCQSMKSKSLYGVGWLRVEDVNPPNDKVSGQSGREGASDSQ